MASIDDIRNIRIEKLKKLEQAGMSAFPIESKQDKTISEIVGNFSKFKKQKKATSLVGRVLSLRPQGGLIFFNFDDGTGKFQGLLKKEEEISLEQFNLFSDCVDIGDFIEVKGTFFETKRGEKTIAVSDWKMLSKSLRPLPEKWHGLQDADERFRKRYLDVISNPEVKERFITRSRILSEIRKFLDKAGFLEVETPILQHQAGGATALPFKTHHNALDMDLYLRIAPELYLKRLLVAGFPKVYELGRNFRNEGISISHNPEFTMLEYYEAWSTAKKQMQFTEKLIKEIVKKVSGKTKVDFDGKTIDFTNKFETVSYLDLLKRYALIANPESINKDEARLKADQLGVKVDAGDSRETILDKIYKKACRPKIVQPTFIVDYPVNTLPLAKRSPNNPEIVDAFQIVIDGMEVVKAFSELNDPIDQKSRFDEQDKMRKEGDAEAQASDDDFLEAMEHGMPPAGGVGIGIDRLVMLLTNTKNIREVILFPTLRAK